ncbi:MAG: LuxR C-terminal-related transcriptional regulator [Devosia sp.]
MSDQDGDREAIIALIHRNRIAIWTQDIDTWETCFVHTPYAARWGYWRQGGIFFRQGWDNIVERARRPDGTAGNPPANLSYAHDTKVENLNLQISQDMAWATFDQIYPGDIDDHVGPGLVREMRVFEKHDGEWKIAFLGFLDGNAGPAGAVILRLDPSGQVLWRSPAAPAAFAESDDVVIRAGRLRFRDAAVDRKLQDALRWAADLDRGYMSTHGAVPILVEAGEGLPTRIYWVVVDAGTIVFQFGSAGLSEDRLRVASVIYGLSPAQQRLASLVAENKSLNEIAAEMKITANTARTHLNRVFEKTGVRTQTALVRVLLSAASPV